MARASSSRSPFNVTLLAVKRTPGNTPRFDFEVRADMAVQRYEIDAANYETAIDFLMQAVEYNLRNAGYDVAASLTRTYYNERESSRVGGAAIATIAAATLAASWLARKLYTWIHHPEEQ